MSTWQPQPPPSGDADHELESQLVEREAGREVEEPMGAVADAGAEIDDGGHSAKEPGLPTMADLDGLARQLDAVDATLARLDADGLAVAPNDD